MQNNFEVGIIWGVSENNVTIKMYDISSDFKYFFNGIEYEGIRSGGYLSITRGHIDIICQIESEEIKDIYINIDKDKLKDKNAEKERYEKYVYAKCIGYFENGKFKFGIKHSPIIYNTVKMMNKDTVKLMFNTNRKSNQIEFILGKEIQYEVDINLPWNKIFNSHIGIFGNTGSGKSNTLTKLYTTLFNHSELNLANSKFIFIDFNGEYIGNNVLSTKKIVYKLNTREAEDKFILTKECFWNEEILGILFHATEKTQKPFLKNLINEKSKYESEGKLLLTYLKKTYKKIFMTQNPKKETLGLMERVLEIINCNEPELKKIIWHSKSEVFKYKDMYSNENHDEIIESLKIDSIKIEKDLDCFDELQIRINLFLINGVIKNHIQYENINPLLTRISATSKALKKIINIVDAKKSEKEKIKIISLRNCNQEIKKLFPILLAKEYFREHKDKNTNGINETFHLIIDEAHNILSSQSNRESEIWKDYRLELFEEIIKEGRKFGFFLTIASQRPADISETIMSQFHNFFIHRLINDKDLRLINNVISTLDRRSKGLIPTLPQGACITTGTSFDFPQIIQVDKLCKKEERPNSDDIDLEEFWSLKKGEEEK
ncbi:ATP-binding protein [Cetobacterium ceti]